MTARTSSAHRPVRELVLASAGSGKTYRISSRILELLARGEEPRSILASTFTRKAAGEILQRVLVRLAQAADDAAAASKLASEVLPAEREHEGDRSFWIDVLSRTVAELHRLNIGTLDAFFVRAAQNFAHDLGLPARWAIADTPTVERVRAQALDRVLEQDGAGFVDLFRALHAGSVRRSVHETLARDVDKILEVHRDIVPGSPGWGALRALGDVSWSRLQERAGVVAETLAGVDVPLTKSNKRDSRWEKAVAALMTALQTMDWDSIVGKGLGNQVLSSDDPTDATYYGVSFPNAILEATLEAIELARSAIGRQLADRAAAMETLASTYEETFLSGLRNVGSLRFEDVTRMLLAANALGRRAELAYRLDQTATHLLLDEFQDTSGLQWQALQPLTDQLIPLEAGAQSGSTVVVADPKQSIYGWRGAAPIVVSALAERYGLPVEPLAKSWRSSQVVLDAVNRVFEGLLAAEIFSEREDDRETIGLWLQAFSPHVAQKVDLPGHVLLQAGPAREGTRTRQPALSRFAAIHIADLYREAPGFSIGVLTRGNDEVARLIHELGLLGVPASEEGGTTLVDSPAVASILALLRLVDHPGDGMSRYHVAATPVGAEVGLTDWTEETRANAVARAWRRRLMEQGYGRSLADLATALKPALSDRDRVRVGRLVELGYAWDAQGGSLRVDDFVRRAETERSETPGDNPVRVMTVHGSKGLEFDIVVLPQLHMGLTGRSDLAPLGYRPGGIGGVTHAFPYVKDGWLPLLAHIPEVTQAAKQRRADRLRDALGVLYVGMTRARHALHLIIPADADDKAGKAQTPARILRETLPPLPVTEAIGEGEVVFEAGRADWMRLLPAPSRPGAPREARPAGGVRLRTDAPRSRGLDRRTPSQPGEAEMVDVGELLGIGRSSGALRRGSVVHAWLQTLEWLEQGMDAEAALVAIARRIASEWNEEETQSTLRWLRERLEAPAMAGPLRRASWPTGTRVERELPFIVREGDTLVEGVLDRLVLIPGPDGTVAEAVVIDYKTDRVMDGPGAQPDRTDHYREQLRTYLRSVQVLYGLGPAQVRGMLLFLDSGRSLEIAAR